MIKVAEVIWNAGIKAKNMYRTGKAARAAAKTAKTAKVGFIDKAFMASTVYSVVDEVGNETHKLSDLLIIGVEVYFSRSAFKTLGSNILHNKKIQSVVSATAATSANLAGRISQASVNFPKGAKTILAGLNLAKAGGVLVKFKTATSGYIKVVKEGVQRRVPFTIDVKTGMAVIGKGAGRLNTPIGKGGILALLTVVGVSFIDMDDEAFEKIAEIDKRAQKLMNQLASPFSEMRKRDGYVTQKILDSGLGHIFDELSDSELNALEFVYLLKDAEKKYDLLMLNLDVT